MKWNLASLKAEHLKGQTNLKADWLIRKDLDLGKCILNTDMLMQFTHRFRTLVIDLLASLSNCQVKGYL